jgi:hypothetical protein
MTCSQCGFEIGGGCLHQGPPPGDNAYNRWQKAQKEKRRGVPAVVRGNRPKIAREFDDIPLADWARKYIKIRTIEFELSEFIPRPGQKRLFDHIDRCRANKEPIRVLWLDNRQLAGKSTGSIVPLFGMSATKPFSDSLVITHEQTLSMKHLEKVNIMYDHLPAGEQPKQKYNERRMGIVFDEPLVSRIDIETGIKQGRSATGQGRGAGIGATYRCVLRDEAARIPADVMKLLSPTIPDKPDTLDIWSSTAWGAHGEFYELAQRVFTHQSNYYGIFVAWHEYQDNRVEPGQYHRRWWDTYTRYIQQVGCSPYKSMPAVPMVREAVMGLHLTEKEEELYRAHNLDISQLLWRRHIIEDVLRDERLFEQEYPSDWRSAFLSTGESVFPAEKVDDIRRTCVIKPAMGTLYERHPEQGEDTVRRYFNFHANPMGHLAVWQEPEEDTQYVIGVDPAQGRTKDSDDQALIVVKRRNIAEVARWKGKIELTAFAKFCDDVRHWYQCHGVPALTIVEENPQGGGTVVLQMLWDWDPENIYFRRAETKLGAPITTALGFKTSVVTKEHLVSPGVALITSWSERNPTCIIPDEELLNQMLGFVQQPSNSSWQHRIVKNPYGEDDLVMAWLLAIKAHHDEPLQVIEQPERYCDDSLPEHMKIFWKARRARNQGRRSHGGKLVRRINQQVRHLSIVK